MVIVWDRIPGRRPMTWLCNSRDSGPMCSDPSDDLAAEFDRLVLELGREQASRIWLERFSGYDEGQT